MSPPAASANFESSNSHSPKSHPTDAAAPESQAPGYSVPRCPSPSTVLLCTYPDSLGGNLATLFEVMEKDFGGAFAGTHILPFYPSAGDRGFAPLTHLEVAPEWGSWQDIRHLTQKYLVMSDLIAGHIATTSKEFRDFKAHGQRSPYADLFLTAGKVWTEGSAPLSSLAVLCHYSGHVPLHLLHCDDGTYELLFRSYLPEQADLDINSSATRSLLVSYIEGLHSHGVQVLRLDAVETLVKDAHSGYFCSDRKLEVMRWLKAEISARGMHALAEVYVGQSEARSYHNLGLFTYGFGLVDHLLHALWINRVDRLVPWLETTSPYEFTFISNHDGFVVGLNDIGLPSDELLLTREWLLENGGKFSKMGSGECLKNVNIHAVNGTLYEVLGRDENAWLLAQALVLLGPGVPVIYYNDLLRGQNDSAAMIATGEGRSLHRHNYTRQEISEAVAQPAVQRLLNLVNLRRTHSAFRGASVWKQLSPTSFTGHWQGDHGAVQATFDIGTKSFDVVVSGS